jgi:response regulator RpfG family c-di-GMP phosphodiesterase
MLFDASVDSASEMRTLLAKAGVDVVEWASRGAGWVTAWENAKVDLVVVDYVLAKRDGLYIVEKVKELNPTCAILFTHSFCGSVANSVELKAFGAGAGGVLQKPISEMRLLRLVEKILLVASKKKAPNRIKLSGT